MITKQDVETMKTGPFTEMIVDLAMRGGEAVDDRFTAHLAITGPLERLKVINVLVG